MRWLRTAVRAALFQAMPYTAITDAVGFAGVAVYGLIWPAILSQTIAAAGAVEVSTFSRLRMEFVRLYRWGGNVAIVRIYGIQSPTGLSAKRDKRGVFSARDSRALPYSDVETNFLLCIQVAKSAEGGRGGVVRDTHEAIHVLRRMVYLSGETTSSG